MKKNVLILSKTRNCPFSHMVKKWLDYNHIAYEEFFIENKNEKNIYEKYVLPLLHESTNLDNLSLPFIVVNEKILIKGCRDFFKNESFLEFILNLN